MAPATIHASAVLAGPTALLVRGASGAGKSRLVLSVIEAAAAGLLPFARLVADDRVHIVAINGRLLARPPEAIAGLLEVRGVGIWRLPYEPIAAIGWVVDLDAATERLPAPAARRAAIHGVTLPRITFSSCVDPLPVLLAALRTAASGGGPEPGPGDAD